MLSNLASQRSRLYVLLTLLLLSITLIVPQSPARALPPPPSTHPRISRLVLQTAQAIQDGTSQPQTGHQLPGTVRVSTQEEIGVEVQIQGPTGDAAAAIANLGIRVDRWSAAFPLVGAWVQPAQLDALAALPMVVYVEPMVTPVTRTGSIVSQGDSVLRAALARTTYGLTGAGVRIGVISDGVEGLAIGQASGELPADCPTPLPTVAPACVLVDEANGDFGNEGRAMLEIIHDLAPGATLGFSSGWNGVTGFVAAIDFLQNEFKADVIVDDIGYLTEPFFENGTIGTRAQEAVDAGVVFVSAAGNDAEGHYQAPLDIDEDCPTGTPRACLHHFAPDDTGLSFTLVPGGFLLVVLQWDNPFAAADANRASMDDLNLYILQGNTVLATSDDDQTIAGQPIEIISFTNASGTSRTVDVVIDALDLNSGTMPEIEMLLITFANPEYLTKEDSIYGHPAMPGVLGVGAVDALSPTLIQSYSSLGPVTISAPTPEIRQKPDLVATDCVATSTPDFEEFCGTSAAAPHVAALAALLLEKEPTAAPWRIRSLLQTSAVDLGNTGFDTIYGSGRADAVAAVEKIPTLTIFELALPLLRR